MEIKKIYLAGPLFTREEQIVRRSDVKVLRANFPDIKFFSPLEVELSVDDPNITNAESTHDFYFNSDINAINESDLLIVDLANDDNGTLLELGIAYGLNKPYIIINSDFRLCETGGMHRNSFVRGVEKKALLVTDSIEKVIDYMKDNM